MKYRYSGETNSFYPWALIDDYKRANSWPENGADVGENIFTEYSGTPPEGKTRAPDANGKPSWIDEPPPTEQEIIAAAERNRKALLFDADAATADWRTELALGIIDDDDTAKLTEWMKYIKAVKAVDTSTAPDVSWPEKPGA